MHRRWFPPMAFLAASLLAAGLSAAPALAQPTYVGSAACGLCHKPIHEKWKDTLHNKSQQEVTIANDPVVVNWSGTVKLKAGKIPEVSIELRETPDGVHHVTLIDAKDPSKRATYPVVRTYGGWGWKQRYQGMGVADIRRLKQLEDENRRLKQVVADLTLDKAMLQDVLRRK